MPKKPVTLGESSGLPASVHAAAAVMADPVSADSVTGYAMELILREEYQALPAIEARMAVQTVLNQHEWAMIDLGGLFQDQAAHAQWDTGATNREIFQDTCIRMQAAVNNVATGQIRENLVTVALRTMDPYTIKAAMDVTRFWNQTPEAIESSFRAKYRLDAAVPELAGMGC